jgi:hypothetical protein
LPASAESTPVTYADAKGQQYIAVVATGGFGVGATLASDALVVFSLSGDKSTDTLAAPVPPQNAMQTAAPAVAASAPSSAQIHLPAGPGHDLTVRVCSGCHSPDLAASQRLSAQEWNSLVQSMSARGAVATDEEFDEISGYLARSFPRSTPPSK